MGYAPPDELDEYELSNGLGELADAKLTQDIAPLLPAYGLLVARLRPNCLRDGEEEIRCKLCLSLAFPLSFAGGSMGMASECSIAMSDGLVASIITSGKGLAMIADEERKFLCKKSTSTSIGRVSVVQLVRTTDPARGRQVPRLSLSRKS